MSLFTTSIGVNDLESVIRLPENVDLYSSVHKGQRRIFFKISSEAGTIDYADEEAVEKFYGELQAFREHMTLHAKLEEKFIHPLLSERVPGGARRLEEEHRIMHQQFNDLVAHLESAKAKPVNFEKRRELALEFYRAWNRFVAFYFAHINHEEEDIQPALWRLCTNEELANAFKLIMANQTPKELMDNLEMMLPAMSLNERVMLLNQGRANMPPEAFQGALRVAENALSSEDWTVLKSKLAIE
jgi:hemerythrin-like domain-containing protein